jgi:hypothetical protein
LKRMAKSCTFLCGSLVPSTHTSFILHYVHFLRRDPWRIFLETNLRSPNYVNIQDLQMWARFHLVYLAPSGTWALSAPNVMGKNSKPIL